MNRLSTKGHQNNVLNSTNRGINKARQNRNNTAVITKAH